MTFSSSCYECLNKVSGGLLTKEKISTLSLPQFTNDLDGLHYLSARLHPSPEKLHFASVTEGLEVIERLFKGGRPVRAGVTLRTDKILEGLLLTNRVDGKMPTIHPFRDTL